MTKTIDGAKLCISWYKADFRERNKDTSANNIIVGRIEVGYRISAISSTLAQQLFFGDDLDRFAF